MSTFIVIFAVLITATITFGLCSNLFLREKIRLNAQITKTYESLISEYSSALEAARTMLNDQLAVVNKQLDAANSALARHEEFMENNYGNSHSVNSNSGNNNKKTNVIALEPTTCKKA